MRDGSWAPSRRVRGVREETDAMFKLPEEMESKYRFVTLAALRAEQLQAGALPRVETASRKATVIAQQEVAGGAVAEWRPDEESVEGEAAPEDEGEEE